MVGWVAGLADNADDLMNYVLIPALELFGTE